MVEKGEYRLLKVTGDALNCRMIERYEVGNGDVVELFDVHGTMFKRIVSGGKVVTTVSIYDYLMHAKSEGLSEVERKLILIKYNDLCSRNGTYVYVRDSIAKELGLDISNAKIEDLMAQCGG